MPKEYGLGGLCACPEFLYVYDPSKGEAVPVQFWARTDEKYATTIDVRATANSTIETTIRNNVAYDRIGNPCDVEVVLGYCFELMTAINVADSALVIRGFWSLFIDRDDCAWVDQASVQTCLHQPDQIGGFANGDVMVGERDQDAMGFGCIFECGMRPFVATNETVTRLTVTFPTGAAETWTLVTWVVKARYSTAPRPFSCVLQPALPGPEFAVGNPQVYVVGRAPQLIAPPMFAGAMPGIPAGPIANYQGVGEAGVPNAGVFR